MEVDNKTIAKYLTEVRRVNESRSKDAEKEIRKLYKGLLKELNSFIGEYYTKYSNDEGILNAAILQQNAKYAAFLEEVDKNINEITPEVSKLIKKTVEDTYKICYKGMVNAFSQAVDSEKLKESFKGLSIKPEVMKAAVQNPIGGLTLPERLKKNRQEVVYDIKQNISNALMTGERYDTTAKKIAERLDINYGKAIRIVRTESHRVQEKGLMEGAEEIGDKIRDDDLIYAAIWRNMGDSRVRPYSRVHTSKGWKTVKSKTHANHVKMEGQIVEAGEYFDLGNGVRAKSPGESGDAANDINCRCYVEYEVMTEEEFLERGGRLKEKNEKMADSSVDWSETKPQEHTKEEQRKLVEYAAEKGITVYNISAFDGDMEIFKEEIDVLHSTLKEYKIRDKVTVEISNKMLDSDFAQTTNRTIMLNTKALRNRTITNRILNEDNYLSSTDISGIIVHEVGHIISGQYGEKGLEIAQKTYYNIYMKEASNDEILSYLYNNVSQYSVAIRETRNRRPKATSYKEITPEILAKNKTNPDEFTKEFIQLLGGEIK